MHTHKLKHSCGFVHQPPWASLCFPAQGLSRNPLMLVPTSLEHWGANSLPLRLISLSTPYKRLLCPKAHTHTHTQWCGLESCQLPVLWLPLPTDPRCCPPGNPWPSFHPLQRPLQNLLSTSCTLSPWPPHLPFTVFIPFLSLPGKSLLPPPSQEPCPINNSLSSLNVLSFLGWFFPLDTESSGFSSISLVHSLRAGSP